MEREETVMLVCTNVVCLNMMILIAPDSTLSL